MGSCMSPPQSTSKPRNDYKAINWTPIWTEQYNLGFDLPTPPIFNHKNEIIFLSTSNDHQTMYTIYNLNTSQFTTKLKPIKCPNNTFDLTNTVYTYNPTNNTIYFIENNSNVLLLNMSNPWNMEIKDLNKSIRTTNNNYAALYYYNNNVYILGDESTSNPSNNQYISVPYSSAERRKKANEYLQVIKKAGKNSRTINVTRDGITSIYILGGIKDYSTTPKAEPQIYPTNDIWTLDISNNKYQWNRGKNRQNNTQLMNYYTQQPQHSFGVINYKNKYIIIFGGQEYKYKKIRPAGYIWILCLCEKDKYGMQKDYWYELHYKLPIKGQYYAIYTELNDEEIIHLFSYNGKYYTIQMKDILNGLKWREYAELHAWTQGGKTVLPTRSKSIDNAGPKEDTQVDNILNELGKMYEQYKDKLKDDFLTLDDILKDENRNKLEELVVNPDHRSAIVERAGRAQQINV